VVGGQSYFDRREIKDFLAYLRLFANPDDDISLLRVANVPARGLSDVTMERLLQASQERSCPVFAAMRHTDVQAAFAPITRQSIERFVQFVERQRGRLRASPALSLRLWAQGFLEEIGYEAELRRSEKNPETADSRVENLRELTATLPDSAVEPEAQLRDFLDDLSLDTEREEENENPGDAVTLITVHSCKGLEFPHVWIVGLEDGLFPHARSKAEGTLEEERRLFYVAMTRAMRTLTLSHCVTRIKYGKPRPCHPSPFLREIPPELLESADEKGRKPVPVDGAKSHFAALRMAAS
jgi:superfamily I DNA/RNA helicase